ncbi:MAG: 30S ribosomal protein S16 [Lentisphaerae bacterium GWF2_44_16]|nr:MAG: 30S ribosomal protein S16 [Lentisphaerae bacterium GWF2_44_16]
MAVRIRLRKMGAKNNASYRIVVADIRSARDGKSIETIGDYDPRRKTEKIDLARAEYWISKGAQPSEKILNIIERAKGGKLLSEIKKKKKPTKKERTAAKAAKEEAAKQEEAAKKEKAAKKEAAQKAREAAKAEAAKAEAAKQEEAAKA